MPTSSSWPFTSVLISSLECLMDGVSRPTTTEALMPDALISWTKDAMSLERVKCSGSFEPTRPLSHFTTSYSLVPGVLP